MEYHKRPIIMILTFACMVLFCLSLTNSFCESIALPTDFPISTEYSAKNSVVAEVEAATASEPAFDRYKNCFTLISFATGLTLAFFKILSFIELPDFPSDILPDETSLGKQEGYREGNFADTERNFNKPTIVEDSSLNSSSSEEFEEYLIDPITPRYQFNNQNPFPLPSNLVACLRVNERLHMQPLFAVACQTVLEDPGLSLVNRQHFANAMQGFIEGDLRPLLIVEGMPVEVRELFLGICQISRINIH